MWLAFSDWWLAYSWTPPLSYVHTTLNNMTKHHDGTPNVTSRHYLDRLNPNRAV